MILQCLKILEKKNCKPKLFLEEDSKAATTSRILPSKSKQILALDDEKEKGVRYQFVDVGTFRVGAVFGIDEEIENRIIIARTSVQV